MLVVGGARVRGGVRSGVTPAWPRLPRQRPAAHWQCSRVALRRLWQLASPWCRAL